MRPPFAYYGGKVGLAPLIAGLLPPHRVYIEPFFGSGAVLFAKPPATIEIANDVDRNVVTFFRMLRERTDEMERACRLTPYARSEFAEADLDEEGIDDLERARRFWVRVNQSFGKTAGRRTGFSVTVARTQSTSMSTWSRISRFAAIVERMQRVVWECCDAVDLIDRMGTSSDTVIYEDPPYLAATRRGRDGSNPQDYREDMGMPEDHVRLAEANHRTSATVILSGYPSPLYEDLYADWHHIDIPVLVHASNSVTAARGERVERIWSNRPFNDGRLDFAGE